MAKLTAIQIKRLGPGLHGDGDGLYLAVGKKGGSDGKGEGSRSWVFRYRDNGRLREMGLGSARDVPLADARRKASDLRRLRADGGDPIATKRAGEVQRRTEAARGVTFRQIASEFIDAQKAGWRNDKHAAQWAATLYTYAYPTIGDLPVGEVDTSHVLAILQPIWATKPETASRIRGRIESILDAATARGLRDGENPARWRGRLSAILPARRRVAKVEHHAALPFAELPAFMTDLKARTGIGAAALRFAIMTAARSGEVRGLRWREIDLDGALWRVPADRMKAGREHRVHLVADALAILNSMASAEGRPDPDALVFPGAKRGARLSDMSLTAVLRRMGRGDVTAHGFRSTFRDWASETTHFPSEVVEMALAHTIESKVEAAYRRGDLLAKRRQLMEAWAEFCSSANERCAPAA